eukprot:TRINITY_DN7863_c0_g1_i1.p1 TRINITY_DN7863_c0_g1~~TRINITY_DN7863_c0_g1_i1.p1  ORF type:complete len:260 (+),score=36.49 TRINITY_DN7863_c0_g1_i1:29-808(+)
MFVDALIPLTRHCGLCCVSDNRNHVDVEVADDKQKQYLSVVETFPAIVESETELMSPALSLQTEEQTAFTRDDTAPTRKDGFEYTIQVQLHPEDDGLGLEIEDKREESWLITAVRSGPIQRWNGNNHGNRCVAVLDRIVKIKGGSGGFSQLNEVLPQTAVQELSLTIRCPTIFRVQIDKGEDTALRVGLGIMRCSAATFSVKSVQAGLVKEWNNRNPLCSIQAGDRIVEVNSERGDHQRILEILSTARKLDFLMYRVTT